MAFIIREALNATLMELPLFCGGMSKVGVNLAGTWAGTVKFYASSDGVNFIPVSVTPFASGTAVTSATANGNWELKVQGFVAFKVVFTRTSGTVLVTIAASIDASYQNAFLASTSLYTNTTATATNNVTTVAAQTNRAWRLRTLTISMDGDATWASSPALKVTDGASTILWAYDPTPTKGHYNIPLPAPSNTPGLTDGGLVNTPGNSMVVTLVSGGGSVKSNVNCEFSAA